MVSQVQLFPQSEVTAYYFASAHYCNPAIQLLGRYRLMYTPAAMKLENKVAIENMDVESCRVSSCPGDAHMLLKSSNKLVVFFGSILKLRF